MNKNLSISGKAAQRFQNSEITPLLALVGFLLGLFAIAVTPQEEEPQINVTFANVFIPFPGASAWEVEQLVSTPAEQVLSEVDGVKNVYSSSVPGMSILTVRYTVGEDRDSAILRLYNAIFSHQDFLPQGLGTGQPLVKPKGIDDVPIVTFTLWSDDPEWGAHELSQVAHTLEAALKQVPGTRDVYTIGDTERVVQVLLDPQKLSGYNLSIDDLRQSLMGANVSSPVGRMVHGNRSIPVQAASFLSSPEEVANLVVGLQDSQPIFLRDVATVQMGPETPAHYVWFGVGPGFSVEAGKKSGTAPAVTLAVAKKPGTNAAQIAEQVVERMAQLQGFSIPDAVHYTVTRNYGATAHAKANKLIGKLAFATFFVVILVLVTMGWREALIVGTAVVLTLALTLFASWAWGFTLNRVSLFALIFSIGILVDDAIVVVENIHRHMHGNPNALLDIIPLAVDEVGGPTILATFTVIAALLPMAFVTGLMGPYMSPIPINASMGMVISLVVAFVVTPWLTYHGLNNVHNHNREKARGIVHEESGQEAAGMLNFFRRVYGPFVSSPSRRRNLGILGVVIFILIVLSVGLVQSRHVVLKMLPFDNKSEFQVVVDMPEDTPLEATAHVLALLGEELATVPEVSNYQVYAGTASPIGFNGLVRQYYLRSAANMGDIQVNLVDSHQRKSKSHQIARQLRPLLQEIGRPWNANVKVVEVPPGPPVMSPLVAEVYGPTYEGQWRAAEQIRQEFLATADIMDVDTSVESEAKKIILAVDRQRAAHGGVSPQAITELLSIAELGRNVSFLHHESAKFPIPIRLELSEGDKSELSRVLSLKLRNNHNELISLSELVDVQETLIEKAIYHKDLKRVVYVTGDMAGALDSPLYGLAEIYQRLDDLELSQGQKLTQYLVNQPENPFYYAVKWEGEWQVTYETFRDMGIAYAVGLILIYLLVVAQFGSYLVPLVIMAPIPLTVIGVMPGHALLAAKFTATSMIGMIALAGIIVRNSILLVDFINDQTARGIPFAEAVIHAGAVRTKPILLTGLAAMLGAFFILDDPIFSGLAIALIFGIFVSTLLTLLIIPVLYYAVMHKRFTVNKQS